MKLCKNLRLGENLAKRRFEVTWKLKHNMSAGNIWVILLPKTGPNLMEICYYEELRKNKQYDRVILAISESKSEAIEIVKVMVEDMYKNSASFDVKAYVGYK